MAPGLRCGSTRANSACLTARSSFTTSTTQSHSRDARQVVVEVADLDELERGGGEERGRAELLQIRQAAEGELVPEGLLAAVLAGAGLGRDHVQHEDRDAGVGHVGGDAAAHDAGAEDRDLSDEAHRRCSLGR